MPTAQQVRERGVRAVAQADPDDLGRGAANHAQLEKILVAGDKDAPFSGSEGPDIQVRRTPMTKRPDVKGAGIQISQRGEQCLGQILVEQQAH